jgi:hypothetical protein
MRRHASLPSEELPSDPGLALMAELLARWEPVPLKLDRDWLMFQAGQAYALAQCQAGQRQAVRADASPAACRQDVNEPAVALRMPPEGMRVGGSRSSGWPGSWLWPAATLFWAGVAAVLAVLLLRREMPRWKSPAEDQPAWVALAEGRPQVAATPPSSPPGEDAAPQASTRPHGGEPRGAMQSAWEPGSDGPLSRVDQLDLVAEVSAATPLYARMLAPSIRALKEPAEPHSAEQAPPAATQEASPRRFATPTEPLRVGLSPWQNRAWEELGICIGPQRAQEPPRPAWWQSIFWKGGEHET